MTTERIPAGMVKIEGFFDEQKIKRMSEDAGLIFRYLDALETVARAEGGTRPPLSRGVLAIWGFIRQFDPTDKGDA